MPSPTGSGDRRWTPLLRFFCVYVLATAAAAVSAPFVLRWMVHCREHFPTAMVDHILRKPLGKLVSRIRWLPIGVGLVWMLRHGGFPSAKFPRWRDLCRCLRFFSVGVGLVAVVCAVQLFRGNCHWRTGIFP